MWDWILSLRLSLGQFLHVPGCLQGLLPLCLVCSVSVWVEARTRQSERFLFHLRPKMTVVSTKCRVPLDLPRICQFLDTIYLIGGFSGL